MKENLALLTFLLKSLEFLRNIYKDYKANNKTDKLSSDSHTQQ